MSPLGPARRPAPEPGGALRLAAALEATAPHPATAPPAGAPDEDRLLPVPEALAPLVPGAGLARGAVTEVADTGMGLLWALAGTAARDPHHTPAHRWIAIVGIPEAGLLALTETGADPDRLLLADRPGRHWADIAAALAGAVDILVLRPPTPVTAETARRLGAVLRRGRAALLTPAPWPGSTLRLAVAGSAWLGLGQGHGLIHSRQVQVEATGRGRAGGPARTTEIWLPDPDGRIRTIEPGEHRLPETPGQAPAAARLTAIAHQ
ncbi:hypothetical protein ACFYNO_32595 [Kitasatospora sp. NPDC006697]|uniref:hypothetical protein n=1 Tax=Kitasatospora sp. NPDC006697 TaxID=3364020 RepID=UPI0036936645